MLPWRVCLAVWLELLQGRGSITTILLHPDYTFIPLLLLHARGGLRCTANADSPSCSSCSELCMHAAGRVAFNKEMGALNSVEQGGGVDAADVLLRTTQETTLRVFAPYRVFKPWDASVNAGKEALKQFGVGTLSLLSCQSRQTPSNSFHTASQGMQSIWTCSSLWPQRGWIVLNAAA